MIGVLILGGGLIGTSLKNYLYDKDNIDWFLASYTQNIGVDYYNIPKLAKYCMNNNIKYIVNCSGFTGSPNVDECEDRKEECWNLNVKLPLDISNMCKRISIEYIHISSGCIYNGYSKDFSETDTPNFGLFDHSSFYSKTKHAFENLCDNGCIIRIRMPIVDDLTHSRNYLAKILKYTNLIDFKNSKTYVPDLCKFIHLLITKRLTKLHSFKLINFCNPDPLDTRTIYNLIKNAAGNVIVPATSSWPFNINKKIVNIEELNLRAPRSNCILDTSKLKTSLDVVLSQDEMHNFLLPEKTIITNILSNIGTLLKSKI